MDLQRISAFRSAGEAYLRVRAQRNALHYYGRELETAKAKLDKSNALLAAAYRDMATVHMATGATKQADVEMGLAESTLDASHSKSGTMVTDDQYRRAMRVLLSEHASIARKLGDDERAAELSKKAQDIGVIPPGEKQ
jgi:hypothetical protein